MSKVMIAVDEDALELLDKYIKSVYSHRCWMTNYPEMSWEVDEEAHSKVKVGKVKAVAKSFGLYPYNQTVVRHP